jgi:indolepyruvate decarboxylase
VFGHEKGAFTGADCRRSWFTARVTTFGELAPALARAGTGESASYIEVVGGRMDFPAGLTMAHQRLDAMYGNG